MDGFERLPSDEHERFAVYLARIEQAGLRDGGTLLATFASDRDPVTGDSATLALLDRLADSSSPEAFRSWCQANETLLQTRTTPAARARDWLVVMDARDGASFTADAIEGSSDWLQLRLASELDPAQGLGVLADVGRTRRIRTAAQRRRA